MGKIFTYVFTVDFLLKILIITAIFAILKFLDNPYISVYVHNSGSVEVGSSRQPLVIKVEQ